jgi:hypothetical protein
MTADIINLADLRPADPNIRNPLAADDHGRTARDALIALAETLPSTIDNPDNVSRWADWILTNLWIRGFKAVPLEPSDT